MKYGKEFGCMLSTRVTPQSRLYLTFGFAPMRSCLRVTILNMAEQPVEERDLLLSGSRKPLLIC